MARKAKLDFIEPAKKHHEYLRYKFSEEELKEIGKLLAEANQRQESIESDKKRIMSEFKSKLDEQESLIQRYAQCISSGYEPRQIECGTFFNDPSEGKKTIRRLDTLEIVKVETMSGDEMQQTLDLKDDHELVTAD